MARKKKWLKLNTHGKNCLKGFILSLSASDLLTSEMDYLHDRDLIDYIKKYPEPGRHPVAGKCLTDLGVYTVMHYFPTFDPDLSQLVTDPTPTEKASTL